MKASLWITRYHLGFSAMDEVLHQAIRSLQGQDEATIRARTHEFYEREVKGQLRPGAREAIKLHKNRGDKLVLLTSSSNYISEKVAEDLSLDAWLCNRFEVDAAGKYTGKALGDLCYGQGKVIHARRYAQAQGIELNQCVFYTDSWSDLPVMLEVGEPVAVNPDPRLKREARRRGWSVEDWGQPE